MERVGDCRSFLKSSENPLTCRKLQSVASHRRTELLHHHYTVFVESPFQQGDYSDTCRKNTWWKSVNSKPDISGSRHLGQLHQGHSPSASVFARLVVLLAVSQFLMDKIRDFNHPEKNKGLFLVMFDQDVSVPDVSCRVHICCLLKLHPFSCCNKL